MANIVSPGRMLQEQLASLLKADPILAKHIQSLANQHLRTFFEMQEEEDIITRQDVLDSLDALALQLTISAFPAPSQED